MGAALILCLLVTTAYAGTNKYGGAYDAVLDEDCDIENCFANACDVTSCPQQRGATCRTTCNGCVAHFFDKFGNEVTDKCQCPGGQKGLLCDNDPCDTAKCNLPSPRVECRTNTCGGKCKAVFYEKFGRIVKQCPKKGRCKSKNPVKCSENPCEGATCPTNPDANCRYGPQTECKAVFYDQLGNVIECESLREEPPCDDILCETDACITSICPRQMGAVCRSTCNGCFPNYFDIFGNDITDQCTCTSGTPTVCDNDPCLGATCGTNFDVECRFDSCGGCVAIFYDESGNVVTC